MLSNCFRQFGYSIFAVSIVFVVCSLASYSSQAETDIDVAETVEADRVENPDNPENTVNDALKAPDAASAAQPEPDTAAPARDRVNAAPTENTDATTLDGWAGIVGTLRSKEITIEGPRLTINLPDKGGVASVTITSGKKNVPLGQMMNKLAFKKISLKDGTFVFRTSSGFTQTIYAVDATLTGDKNSNVSTAKGTFKFRGEQVSFELNVAKPPEEASSGVLPIGLTLRGDNINVQLAGNINLHDGLEIKGKLKLALADLRFVSAWLGYPLSKGSQTTKLDADGQFSWRGSLLSFSNAEFEIGKSEGTGALSIDLAQARPSVDATLAFDQVDLRNFFEEGRRQSQTGDRTNYSTASGVDERPLEETSAKDEDITEQYSHLADTYLNDFDVDLRLSADRIFLSTIEAQDCAITMTLQSGDLLLGLIESKIAGGMVLGELSLKNETEGRVTNLRADLENVQTGILAKLFDLPGLIKGPANIKLDLTGHGQGWKNITKSLSGDMKISMNGPVQIGTGAKYIKHQSENANALKWWLDIKDDTRFQSFKNILKFKNGMIGAELIDLRSSAAKIEGNGTIDIVRRTGNILLRRSQVTDASEKKLAGFDDKSADNIRIFGPWKKLIISPNTINTGPGENKPMPEIPGRKGANTGGSENLAPDPGRG